MTLRVSVQGQCPVSVPGARASGPAPASCCSLLSRCEGRLHISPAPTTDQHVTYSSLGLRGKLHSKNFCYQFTLYRGRGSSSKGQSSLPKPPRRRAEVHAQVCWTPRPFYDSRLPCQHGLKFLRVSDHGKHLLRHMT